MQTYVNFDELSGEVFSSLTNVVHTLYIDEINLCILSYVICI